MKNIDLNSASTILIPKGDDNVPCIEAFQIRSGIEIPDFAGEKLLATSEGRTFYKLKGEFIPDYVARGFGDVGLVGTDVSFEYCLTNPGQLSSQRIGAAMCRFSLLGERRDTERMQALLATPSRSQLAMEVATRRPAMLASIANQRELPIVPSRIPVNGSEEVVFRLLGLQLGSSIVLSGETARQNDVAEVMELCQIYPEAVIRTSYEDLQ